MYCYQSFAKFFFSIFLLFLGFYFCAAHDFHTWVEENQFYTGRAILNLYDKCPKEGCIISIIPYTFSTNTYFNFKASPKISLVAKFVFEKLKPSSVTSNPSIEKEPMFTFQVLPICNKIKKRMRYSWRDNNPVPLEELRYIQLSHWGFDGHMHKGELIMHKDAVNEIVEIFQELFKEKYPIEKMLLIDAYEADDNLSCEDNNTSAFCSRPITGSESEWSLHSFGLAIDINPLLNPYKKGDIVVPVSGKRFLDRSINCRGIITKDDVCYRAFISRNWKWGGDWYTKKGYVDYQHFYKEIPIKF